MSTINKFRSLVGTNGLLPVPRFLEVVPFKRAPSIFHLHYSDRFATALACVGALLAAAALLGLPDEGPLWLSMLVWLSLWALYLSFVNAGQTFYGFVWETLLLEAGFLAIFLGNAKTAPPLLVILLIRWLLIRLELGAGLIKLRHDEAWRDLTALHTTTRPSHCPTPWPALPPPPEASPQGGGGGQPLLTTGLSPRASPSPARRRRRRRPHSRHQLWLVLSGNYAWLNFLTIALATSSFDDGILGRILPIEAPALQAPPGWFQVAVLAMAATVAVLSYWPVRNMASSIRS